MFNIRMISLILCITIPSFATIAQVGSCQTASATGGNTATTAGFDTTGATLLTITVGGGALCTGSTVSDSNSNTWNSTTDEALPGGGDTCTWYAYSKAGGALVVGAAHTASVGSNNFPAIVFCAWSGTLTGASNPFDSTAGTIVGQSANSSSTTVQPGSITCSNSGSLLITTCGTNGGSSMSINSGFTIGGFLDFNSGVNYGNYQGYLIQGAPAAVNPTWTIATGTAGLAATISCFQASAGGGGAVLHLLNLLGVGN